jgi:hypothetical protein
MRSSKCYLKAVEEVKSLPYCICTYKAAGISYYKNRIFNIRILDNEEVVAVQFGEKKTFDRWSNSVNFEIERSKGRRCYYPVLRPQYEWMKKVLDTGLFDFCKIIGAVPVPWFESNKNG